MDIIPVDIEEVFLYLKDKNKPVMEIELIRHFTGGFPRDGEEALFRAHFSIYHALYLLKHNAGKKGYYLHLDTMRIALVMVPDGQCAHYLPEKGEFCKDSANGTVYCTAHGFSHHDESFPSYDPLQDFYLNPDNISFGNTHILKRIMNGILIYSFRKGEIEEALVLFDLVHPNRNRIQKRYRQLARKHHPDGSGGSVAEMKKLNHAYSILKEVFVV